MLQSVCPFIRLSLLGVCSVHVTSSSSCYWWAAYRFAMQHLVICLTDISYLAPENRSVFSADVHIYKLYLLTYYCMLHFLFLELIQVMLVALRENFWTTVVLRVWRGVVVPATRLCFLISSVKLVMRPAAWLQFILPPIYLNFDSSGLALIQIENSTLVRTVGSLDVRELSTHHHLTVLPKEMWPPLITVGPMPICKYRPALVQVKHYNRECINSWAHSMGL